MGKASPGEVLQKAEKEVEMISEGHLRQWQQLGRRRQRQGNFREWNPSGTGC